MKYISETEIIGLSDQLDVEEERQGGITSDSLVSGLSNWVDDDVKEREDGGIFTEENKESLGYDTHEMTMRPP